MNANQMLFFDNTFDAVTSFFTLMYIDKTEYVRVIEEVYGLSGSNTNAENEFLNQPDAIDYCGQAGFVKTLFC